MKSKVIQRNLALFMIALVVMIPFYVAEAYGATEQVIDQFQENTNLPNPVSSCIEKNKETHDLVEFLESGPISALEKIASILFFTCSVWNAIQSVEQSISLLIGFVSDSSCKNFPQACAANEAKHNSMLAPFTFMEWTCDLTECVLCNSAEEGSLSPAQAVNLFEGETQEALSEAQQTATNVRERMHLSPYDNIYVATACFCPVGILFNLRKLKTIYQVHECCIQEACANGISTLSCDRQLSEATCMYWEGSVMLSLVKVLMSLISEVVAELFVTEFVEELQKKTWTKYIQAAFLLYGTYQHLSGLQGNFQWLSQTFSEPTCSDLGFEDIEKQIEAAAQDRFCNIVQVDEDEDGIADLIETRCVG